MHVHSQFLYSYSVLKAEDSVTIGGSKGPPKDAPRPIIFVFMQFSGEIGQNIRLAPHIWN